MMRAVFLIAAISLLPLAGMAQTLTGSTIPNPLPTAPQASSSGGAGVLCNLSLKATATVCDASPGQIADLTINNLQNSVEEDVQLYAVAQGSVTVGTTTVTKCMAIGPASLGHFSLPAGLAFANAITVAVTTGVSSACTGTTAPTNNVGVTIDGK